MNQKVINLYNSIPWRKVGKELSNILGSEIKIESHELKETYSGNVHIAFSSQNVADKCGILASSFKYLKISEFSSGIVNENRALQWWASVCFNFKYIDGGSNAHVFAYIKYSRAKGLTIEMVNER